MPFAPDTLQIYNWPSAKQILRIKAVFSKYWSRLNSLSGCKTLSQFMVENKATDCMLKATPTKSKVCVRDTITPPVLKNPPDVPGAP